MAFSFTDYASMKPGEDRFNPVTAILQGLQQRNQMQQQKAALANALLSQKMNQQKLEYPAIGKSGMAGLVDQLRFYNNNPGSMNTNQNMGMQGNQSFDPNQLMQEALQAERTKVRNEGLGLNYLGAGARENEYGVQVLQDQFGWDRKKAQAANEAYMAGRNTLDDGTKLPAPPVAFKNSLDRQTKYGSDESQRAQWRYANTLQTTFDQLEPLEKDAFEYAGIVGKLKGGSDAFKAQFGENDPRYQHFLQFTRQGIPALATEILRTGGASSTDAQKAWAIMQTNPITWDSNPDLAMNQYKFLKQLYKSIGKTISKGTSELRSDIANPQSEQSPISTALAQKNDPLGIL